MSQRREAERTENLRARACWATLAPFMLTLAAALASGCGSDATTAGVVLDSGATDVGDSSDGDTGGTEVASGPEDTGSTEDAGPKIPCASNAECASMPGLDPCLTPRCDTDAGHCVADKLVNGTPCDDGDACTEETVCFQGLCGGISEIDADPRQMGASCFDNNDCDSGFCVSLTETKQICTELCLTSCPKGFQCKSVVNLQQDVTFICVPIGGTGFAAECDDHDVCTNDTCDPAAGCLHDPGNAPCDDGNACTVGDTCKDGTCQGSPSASCACESDGDCAIFDDSDLCNGTLACTDGACVADPTSAVVCPAAPPGSCESVACEPATGQCVFSPKKDGAVCSDGNSCTQPDACESGVCGSGQDICGACEADEDCAPFDDGNACNGTLACTAGTCAVDPATVPSCAVEPGQQCSAASCDPATGECLIAPATDGTPCSDGDPCTQGDVCGQGACKPGKAACDLCAQATDGVACDDGDPCTAGDTCQGGACKGGVDLCAACDGIPEGGACDDQDPCTESDACHDGICGGAAYVCDDEVGCTTDQCNGDGTCSFPVAPDGTACEDGNPCTADDLCASGECQAGAGVACDDGSPCTVDSCDPETGCAYAPSAFGVPCDDDDLCTEDDLCVGGFCMGGGEPDCDDQDPCTTDSCDLLTGCVHAPSSGPPCDDGNACTSGDTCTKGVCFPGPPLSCNDGSLCTDDACDPATGCTHAPNTAPCTDGNPCTANDTCEGGGCVSGANICQCTTDADCADQSTDLCTGKLACVAMGDISFCAPDPSSVVVCPGSSSPCIQTGCDPATGECVKTPIAEGAACEDGNACTTGSTCEAGACVAGTTLECEDGNPCTVDACDLTFGCTHTPATSDCDDGNPCSGGDSCKNGVCSPGAMVICDDGNLCTDDLCDPASGCVYVPNLAPCSDGNPCSLDDTCADGACVSGEDICGCDTDADCADYDDGNACNGTLFCDHATVPFSCKVAQGTVVTCDAGGDTACSESQCDPATGQCVPTAVNDGAPCQDEDPCTIGGLCADGQCSAGGAAGCDDGNPCTVDACDPAAGCVHTDSTAPCSDGNACTEGDTCSAGACVPGPNACGCQTDADCAGLDDGNLCNGTLICDTAAAAPSCVLDPSTVVKCVGAGSGNGCSQVVCEPTTGACKGVAAPEGTPCDDGNFCTQQDLCAVGKCVGTLPVSCDDGNTCTADFCSPAKGCVHTPVSSPCEDGDLCTKGDKCDAGHCIPGKNTCKCKKDSDCDKKDDGNACNGTYQCVGAPKDPKKKNPKIEGFCLPLAETIVTCADAGAYDCKYTVCDPVEGLCDAVPAPLGSPCDDGDGCTAGDYCEGGECTTTMTVSCDDGNPCTADACESGLGCVHTPAEGACDDGLSCTTGDACSAGVCKPSVDDCGCETTADCAAWDDGNPCSGQLVCSGGHCKVDPGTVVQCGLPTDACQAVACNPATGMCEASSVEDGLACNDLDPCTYGETCTAGACQGGDAVLCDDQNQCTTDACVPGVGCVYSPRNGECDDGNPCSFPDICTGGLCLSKKSKCK